MSNVQSYKTPNLTIIDGQVKTTSLAIAELFGKRHDNVLRDIETIKANCSLEFSELNFEFSVYDGLRREEKCYDISRDGMTMIIMGYTGVEAMRFKEAYITAFNKMEAELTRLQTVRHTVKKSIQSTQDIDLARQNVLKIISKAGSDDGIFESRLLQCCAGFKKLNEVERDDLIMKLIKNREITMSDRTKEKTAGKKGRKFFIK